MIIFFSLHLYEDSKAILSICCQSTVQILVVANSGHRCMILIINNSKFKKFSVSAELVFPEEWHLFYFI